MRKLTTVVKQIVGSTGRRQVTDGYTRLYIQSRTGRLAVLISHSLLYTYVRRERVHMDELTSSNEDKTHAVVG